LGKKKPKPTKTHKISSKKKRFPIETPKAEPSSGSKALASRWEKGHQSLTNTEDLNFPLTG
jgi:hypothetical protein